LEHYDVDDERTNRLIMPPQPNSTTVAYLLLLSIQFGIQPLLTQQLISPSISKTSVVVASELVKLALGLVLLLTTIPFADRAVVTREWSLAKAARRAVPPAVLYSIQNYLILFGSMSMSAMSLSLLNQTKTLSAALFAYLLLGKTQTKTQIVALCGLVVGAALIVAPWSAAAASSSPTTPPAASPALGIAAVSVASLLSGMSSAWCERALQASPSPSLSLVFSMELAVFSLVSLFLATSSPIPRWNAHAWTWKTWIPVITNAGGGILVGMVTQRAGGVAKGIALIFGIIFTCLVESLVLQSRPVSLTDGIAVCIVCVSLYLHNAASSSSSRASRERKVA
jgi:UDP-sugar transporter A1/2/3